MNRPLNYASAAVPTRRQLSAAGEWLATMGIVVIGMLLKWAIDKQFVSPWFTGTGFTFQICAVALVAWLYRTRHALVALVLMVVGLDFFFFEPKFSFGVHSATDFNGIIRFAVIGLVLIWFQHRSKKSEAARVTILEKLLEATRRASTVEMRLDTALNALTDPLALYKSIRDEHGEIADFEIIYLNRAASSWNADEDPESKTAVGKRLSESVGRVVGENLMDDYRQVVATGTPVFREAPLRISPERQMAHIDLRIHKLDDGVVVQWRDITESKRAQEIVRDSERHLRRLLNSMYTFVAVLTPEGIVVDVNDSPLRLANISREQVLGHPFWEGFWFTNSPENQERLKQVIKNSSNGEVHRYDVEIRSANGLATLDFMLAPMVNDAGQITELVASGVDISDRKRAERQLAERERHYRQLTEGLPQLTWTSTADGTVDFVNAQWADYTGKATTELLSHPLPSFYHPEDVTRVQEAFDEASRESRSLQCEARLMRSDGEYRWFDMRATPLRDEFGKPARWFGTNYDIDSLRRAEQRFRRLYESNLIGIFFFKTAGPIIDYNDEMLRLLGYTKDERATLDATHPTPMDWLNLNAEQMQDLKSAIKSRPSEQELLCRNGSHTPVMIAAADLDPGFHDQGIAFVVDITALKLAESALRESEGRLLLINESLEMRVRDRTREVEARSEQLRALVLDLAETESRERKRLAQILHDHFQQLVSAAKLKVGIMRRKLTDPNLLESIRQTEELLGEAITASRTLATELSPPVLHDAGLGAGLEWLARRMERDHDLAIIVEIDSDCEPDNDQIRVILFECARELLFNVVKHAGVHKATLKLSSPHDGLIHLSVSDEGVGFDPQSIELSRKPDGSFGLFSIRERLSLIGGLARVRSAPGEGATIELTVPANIRIVNKEHTPRPELSGPHSIPTDLLPTIRVMVADDHKLFREGLISLLTQESFVEIVGQANDGAEAVELALQLKPDVLFVDVSMPRLNGVQVTQALSRELPNMRIIGLSMHEREDM
ncbi:MAG TPA: PAS domain S-box protein, partial [Tepidisphaeraceae bacterium]|nr:PAS domain S-box protein [Tepidisphaeraceae bacterium]